jgi:hypothetical protein
MVRRLFAGFIETFTAKFGYAPENKICKPVDFMATLKLTGVLESLRDDLCNLAGSELSRAPDADGYRHKSLRLLRGDEKHRA